MANDTPLDPMKSFQDRILDKVRKDIADMLPEEAVQKLFEQGIQSIFFKEIPPAHDDYGRVRQVGQPSWFAQEIVIQAKPLIEATIKARINEFESIIKEEVNKVLTAESVVMIASITASQTVARLTMVNVEDTAQRVARYIKQGY